MPRKVWGAGSLKHRERPATHNVGLVGVSCCGHLRLELGQHVVALFCDGCGARIEMRGVIPSPPEPQVQKPWDPTEDHEDDVEPWGV